MRVDGIEIALELLKDVSERLPVIARCTAGKLFRQITSCSSAAAHIELDKTAIDDCVVRPTHGIQEIRMRCWNGCPSGTIDNCIKWKFQVMCLVQCHFQNPADNLHGTSQALRRGIDESQFVRRESRRLRHFFDDGGRRRCRCLKHDDRRIGLCLPIGDFLEQRFDARESAYRT